MVKIWASKDGIKKIDSKREEKGWTKDQNSEALIIASQQQFQKKIEEHFHLKEDKTDISIDKLEELLVKEKVFTDNSQFQHYLIKFKRNPEKPIKISLKRCLSKIRELDIHSPGITYRNWQYFLTGKEITDDIFEAFCTALEIENWRDLAIYPPIYHTNTTAQTRLVEGLSLFNHQEQVKLLLEKLAYQSRAFLVANSCHYSRTWMLKCLDAKISAITKLKCNPVNIQGSSYTELPTNQLKQIFLEKYPLKNLKKEHILIVFDIDNYDSQRLEELLNVFWKPLVSQIPPKLPGQVLMFLLSTELNNNWTEELKSNQITELSPANPFKAEDLVQVIPIVYLTLQKQLPPDKTPLEIANNLINKSQGKSEKLLQEIYHHFKCSKTEFSVWQRYP